MDASLSLSSSRGGEAKRGGAGLRQLRGIDSTIEGASRL